jgi:hypothetical protein
MNDSPGFQVHTAVTTRTAWYLLEHQMPVIESPRFILHDEANLTWNSLCSNDNAILSFDCTTEIKLRCTAHTFRGMTVTCGLISYSWVFFLFRNFAQFLPTHGKTVNGSNLSVGKKAFWNQIHVNKAGMGRGIASCYWLCIMLILCPKNMPLFCIGAKFCVW